MVNILRDLLPKDRRGFLFSCTDVGGFEWQNDWFWKLSGEGNKYDEVGLEAFQTIDFNRAATDEPQPFFSVRLIFKSKKELSGHWANVQFDRRLADLVKFSSPRWPFAWLECQGRIIGVLPNTVAWELTISSEENRPLEIYCSFRPILGRSPHIYSKGKGILSVSNAARRLAVAGRDFRVLGRELVGSFDLKGKKKIRLAFSAGSSKYSPEDLARQALRIDLDTIEKKIMRYYRGLPQIQTGNPHWDRLFYKTFDDKRLNILHLPGKANAIFECPDRPRHNSLWLWDSCFHSLTWRHYNYRNLKIRPIKHLLSLQDKGSGFVPITFGYAGNRSQPPVVSWCLRQITKEKKVLGELYPRLVKFHHWWFNQRQVAKTGLCRWGTGDESGLDNAPLWDNKALERNLLCVDLNAQLVLDAECLSVIAKAIGRPEEARSWQKARDELAQKVRDIFWDNKDNFFYNRFLDGGFQRIKTLTSYWVLIAGIATTIQAKSMLEHLKDTKEFASPYPCPSVALSEKCFSIDYWRGPVWIHSNYVVISGLERYGYKDEAEILARKTIDMVARDYERTGYLWECYDPFTGSGEYVGKKGRGPRQIADYYCGWTALVSDLMLRYFNKGEVLKGRHV